MPKIKSEYNDLDKYNYSDGGISYYKKNTEVCHNPYGPAIIGIHGEVEYWIEGKLHRLDGPAVIRPNNKIWPNGKIQYYINGKKIDEEQFQIEVLKYTNKEYLMPLL